MFQTYDVDQLHSPLSKPGEHLWDLVSFILNEPWFHVTFTVAGEKGDKFERSLMLRHIHQLIDLLRRKELSLKFVDVMSPGFVNGSGRWKMDPLLEVWLRKKDDHQSEFHYEHVYILENGEKFSSLAGPPANLSCNKELLFSWKSTGTQ